MILQYDRSVITEYALPLDQSAPHHSGPKTAEARYFFFTGNTRYGIQNLEYDAYRRRWLVAVYPGKKERFSNYPLYCIDGSVAPVMQTLLGRAGEKGLVLSHTEGGIQDKNPSVRGYRFSHGDTGMVSFGDGLYYFSHHGSNREEKSYWSTLTLYRAGEDGSDEPFVAVE